MIRSQLTIASIAGAIGIALGVVFAPMVRKPEKTSTSGMSVTSGLATTSRIKASPATDMGEQGSTRSRTRERVEGQKPKEPRVSIPLGTIVDLLKNDDFKHTSEFDSLSQSIDKALLLLGATKDEQDAIKAIVEKSESEILSAEKIHLKRVEVTADTVHLDMTGMQAPAAEIARRTQDGIRNTLPSDLAESLLSAIDWNEYYPIDEKDFKRLDISRDPSGKLIAWERQQGGDIGYGLDDEFMNDGTPIPAEQIFPDRWKPFLKGVALLPKDKE